MILQDAQSHPYLFAAASVLPFVVLSVITWVVFRTTREVS